MKHCLDVPQCKLDFACQIKTNEYLELVKMCDQMQIIENYMVLENSEIKYQFSIIVILINYLRCDAVSAWPLIASEL